MVSHYLGVTLSPDRSDFLPGYPIHVVYKANRIGSSSQAIALFPQPHSPFTLLHTARSDPMSFESRHPDTLIPPPQPLYLVYVVHGDAQDLGVTREPRVLLPDLHACV